MRRILSLTVIVLVLCGSANAQRAELTINLNEHFFDTLLDAVFNNAAPLEFPLSSAGERSTPGRTRDVSAFSSQGSPCKESVRLLREMNGVRTALRFRDGKIFAPLAFTGNYNPPFVGCVSFAGWAETGIDLEFDSGLQRLMARAKVLNVSMNGTNGAGGNLIARLIQGSIDRRINPIEIIRLDKISLVVPVQKSAVRMKAVAIRHEITNGALFVHVAYDFVKA